MSESLLEVRNLKTWFGASDNPVRAVDGVSFDIRHGETLAVLGESGCGKSITALSLMRLIPEPAGKIISGTVRFGEQQLLQLPEVSMRDVRGSQIAMIFQEPMTSLNPVFTVGHQLVEAITLHRDIKKNDARELAVQVLSLIHI